MTRVAISLLVVAATAVVVFGFLRSDQTPRAMLQFIALYMAGVLSPGLWSAGLHRALRPDDRRTRALAWSPLVVGTTTILLGMASFL